MVVTGVGLTFQNFSVMNQKRDIYNDLQRALTVMKYIDEKTPRNRVFYAMWLLETRQLAKGTNIYVCLKMFLYCTIKSYEFFREIQHSR